MPDYTIFGGCLRADMNFPELPETSGEAPHWTVRRVDTPAILTNAQLLGEEPLGQGVFVRSFKWPGGWRVAFDDTGIFDLSPDGRAITWWPGPSSSVDIARIDVVGRVLAMAMHAAGMICLHGSGVAIGSHGVAFVAPKFHGKSTLALAIAKAGGRLTNDDNVPIETGQPPVMRPGAPRVRLWGDSIDRLGGEALMPSRGSDDKFNLGYLPEDCVMRDALPLAAIYVLTPVPAHDGAAVTRTPLAPVPSAMSLVRHAKLGPLLGKSESAIVLDRAITLASIAPVYELHVVRDFDRIHEVVAQLMEWHGGVALLEREGVAW